MLKLIENDVVDIKFTSDDEYEIDGSDADLEDESESESQNFLDIERNDIEEEGQPEKQCLRTNSGNWHFEAGALMAAYAVDPITDTKYQMMDCL